MSQKYWPILYCISQHNVGQDFLVMYVYIIINNVIFFFIFCFWSYIQGCGSMWKLFWSGSDHKEKTRIKIQPARKNSTTTKNLIIYFFIFLSISQYHFFNQNYTFSFCISFVSNLFQPNYNVSFSIVINLSILCLFVFTLSLSFLSIRTKTISMTDYTFS